jgi:aminopeptidase N
VTPRRTALGVLLALPLSLTACSTEKGGMHATPARLDAVPGATSIGDPITPGDGNGGYDVQHYDLDLRITPRGRPELAGTVTITADAGRALSRFDLDLDGLKVSKVTVGGEPASYRRTAEKLVVTPHRPVAGRFAVSVTYSGSPRTITGGQLGTYGWIHTKDGIFIGAEPDAAHTWFPSNDHPSDKATFGYRVTVPKGLTAVAGGELTGTKTSGDTVTYTWREQDPMATYLAMVDVGRFAVRTGRTPGGIPVYVAVDPAVVPGGPDALYDKTVEITDAWAKMFGPYPFTSTGGIIDDAAVAFALETQTRPEYVPTMGSVPSVVAHELSHQWFGDSVSVNRWSDIWLNEGFATYAEWTWAEREHGPTLQERFDLLYSQEENPRLWHVAPANPGRQELFGQSVYERGAMTLYALQKKVGDEKFFTILRTWAAEHRHGNATTPQFVALAERVSGTNLQEFFQAWLYGRDRPPRS